MVELKNMDDYNEWRRAKQKVAYDDTKVLPARAALRRVPQMVDAIHEEAPDLCAELFAIVFRAGVLALIAPLDDDTLGERRSAVSDAGANGTNIRAKSDMVTCIGRAVGYAAEYIDGRAITYAEYAINMVSCAEMEVRLPAHQQMWQEISSDATSLDEGETRLAVASKPLWSIEMPKSTAKHWTGVKHYLLGLGDEGWWPILDWYEARLRGDLIDADLDRTKTILRVTEL